MNLKEDVLYFDGLDPFQKVCDWVCQPNDIDKRAARLVELYRRKDPFYDMFKAHIEKTNKFEVIKGLWPRDDQIEIDRKPGDPSGNYVDFGKHLARFQDSEHQPKIGMLMSMLDFTIQQDARLIKGYIFGENIFPSRLNAFVLRRAQAIIEPNGGETSGGAVG